MKRLFLLLIVFSTTVLAASAQFRLPPLQYSYDALEPYIDKETMYIHYNNHHGAYVKNLNNALAKYPQLQDKTIEYLISNLTNLPKDIQTSIRNNGGGHYNHTLFWTLLAPKGTTSISPYMEKLLSDNFGSVENFEREFERAATGRFGSGWVWLIKTEDNKLQITSTANQDSPLMDLQEIKQGTPILALDVWEHAYYLKYQSKRADYVNAFWEVVNWLQVEKLAKGK